MSEQNVRKYVTRCMKVVCLSRGCVVIVIVTALREGIEKDAQRICLITKTDHTSCLHKDGE